MRYASKFGEVLRWHCILMHYLDSAWKSMWSLNKYNHKPEIIFKFTKHYTTLYITHYTTLTLHFSQNPKFDSTQHAEKEGYCENWNFIFNHLLRTIWEKVFKNGPSKICGRQSLKNLKCYGLSKQFFKSLSFTNFTWSILDTLSHLVVY